MLGFLVLLSLRGGIGCRQCPARKNRPLHEGDVFLSQPYEWTRKSSSLTEDRLYNNIRNVITL